MKLDVRPIASSNGHSTPPNVAHGRRRLAAILAAIVIVTLVLGVVLRVRAVHNISYITTAVVRKQLVQTVTASGTVNPQNTILIGTQVSGTILEQDADYNSVVSRGQVLTRIDPTSFRAALDNAQAAQSQAEGTWAAGLAGVAAAKQNVNAARATLNTVISQVAKAKAALDLANMTVRRDTALLAPGYIAQTQYDTDAANQVAARSTYEAALIAVPQARAQLEAEIATAQAAQASMSASSHAIDIQRANVAVAQYNLNNTVIRSQVRGTVIARNITIGQTVAASFQTPTLFTLGQDLTKMEVDVAVGEPDVGGVRAGDITDFTVLAYPNRTFHGVVYQVRRNPTTINNVVTYDTVVYVGNRDGALYPGMTANASIHVAKVTNALVVPIAALQYSPPRETRPDARGGATSPWGLTDATLTRTIIAGRNGRLFVMREGNLVRIPVRVLLVSGTEAAIASISPATLSTTDVAVTSDSQTMMAAQAGAAGSALARPQQQSLQRPGGSR